MHPLFHSVCRVVLANDGYLGQTKLQRERDQVGRANRIIGLWMARGQALAWDRCVCVWRGGGADMNLHRKSVV